MIQVNIDAMIEKLLAVRGSNRPGKQVNLEEKDILALLKVVREIFMSQPVLLELGAPIKICGDIHGQYYDLLRIFSFCGEPPSANYLFLGDYVDRGRQGIETFCLLAAYKVKYPENFFMLRGNHESQEITKFYGFYEQCKRRYSVKVWKSFIDVFNTLPIAALIDDRILCMHGGLSPELNKLQNINQIERPIDIPDTGLLTDLMWSDPKENQQGWGQNQRGISFTFGQDVVKFMIQKFKLDLICRAHQVVEDGYLFFCKRQLVTIFSAPNYIGQFDNAAGIMSINESLVCSFQVLKPRELNGPVGSTIARPGTPGPRTM